jgi:DNA-binding transcriptional LysR family regulator
MRGRMRMNVGSLDLNLLLIFQALMIHRSVSRAGREIGLSQPAVSNALGRLRHYYKDPLFLRTPDGMQPTARARDLALPIEEALARIEITLPESRDFSPAQIERRFRIGLVNYGALYVLPSLAERLALAAPGIELVTAYLDEDEAAARMARFDLDVCVGVLHPPEGWRRRILFREKSVAAARTGHPRLRAPLTLEMLANELHVRVPLFKSIDKALDVAGWTRRFAISTGLLTVPFIVARTDLVAVLPSKIAETFQAICSLELFDLPIKLPDYEIVMLTHRRADVDGPLAWLAENIVAVAADLQAAFERRSLSCENVTAFARAANNSSQLSVKTG